MHSTQIDVENFQNQILQLANQFLEIDYLIDNNLDKFKKGKDKMKSSKK